LHADRVSQVDGIDGSGVGQFTSGDFLRERALPVSGDEKRVLKNLFGAEMPDTDVVAGIPNYPLSRGDMRRLRIVRSKKDKSDRTFWLSDSNIDNISFMLNSREQRKRTIIEDWPLMSVACTELSYRIISRREAHRVVKRKNRAAILSHRLFFLPFHLPGHWVLFIIHPQRERILVQGLDSAGGTLKEYAHFLFNWIVLEAQEKGVVLDPNTFEYQDVDVPHQEDSVNCGLCVLKHILFTLDNMLLDTDSCSMNIHRTKWTLDLLRGRIDHLIPREMLRFNLADDEDDN
jgi:Ulp1 family protease